MADRISADRYVDGVYSIYEEDPEYQEGHNGSDGKCDCIGMSRGALEREGVTNVTNLRGTNQAARKTIRNLMPIRTEDLRKGDVVLKARGPGESGYNLPEKYRIGGADFNGDLTDYYHIGTVTQTDPLEITHMTSPKAKKDTKIGNWKYSGQLPWVDRGSEPEPEPEPETQTAIVSSENRGPVNLRTKPKKTAKLVDKVPCGETVFVLEYQGEWSHVRWRNKTGYMMSEFLIFEDEPPWEETYTVTIPGLTKEQAESICQEWPEATKTREEAS